MIEFYPDRKKSKMMFLKKKKKKIGLEIMVSKIRQIVSLFSVSLFSHAESGFTYIYLYTYMNTYIYIHKLKI